MSTEKIDEILSKVDGLIYIKDEKRYVIKPEFVKQAINEDLAVIYKTNANAKQICSMCSRQFYNHVYNKLTWPEDFFKKQYIILTDEHNVRVSRDIMLSHIEATILTRRDLLVLEHGVDFDAGKIIDDYEEHMEQYRFSVDTRSIFNRSRDLSYRERLTNRKIDDLGVGY
jgi:hypothetical protein